MYQFTFQCPCGRQWIETAGGGYQSRSCQNCNDIVVGVQALLVQPNLHLEVVALRERVQRLEQELSKLKNVRRPTTRSPYDAGAWGGQTTAWGGG